MSDRPQVQAEHVFSLSVLLGQVLEIGETSRGRRRVIPITGGQVAGPRLSGTILPGGADYQFVRADGVTELEAHYVLQTTAGLVYVENRGIRVASPRNVERLMRGLPVDPHEVYFRTSPRFEADGEDMAWLSTTFFVASGIRRPDCVQIDVFAVR